jgi:hypothetical protein
MKPSVLIADSDAELCEFYRHFLGEQGYEVAIAADGLDCLEKLRRLRPAGRAGQRRPARQPSQAGSQRFIDRRPGLAEHPSTGPEVTRGHSPVRWWWASTWTSTWASVSPGALGRFRTPNRWTSRAASVSPTGLAGGSAC